MTWIGPRVTKVMGEDLPLLRIFSRVTRNGVPAIAILFQLFAVTIMILTQSFETVLNYIQFAITLSSFLAVLGVMVLRRTKPDLERPYRTWGYPVTPVIFLVVTAFMMLYLLLERPAESFAGLATLIAGLAIYFAANRSTSKRTQGATVGD